MGSLRAIFTVMKKELIQTVRDRRLMPLLIIAPLIQTLVFGYAVNLDLTDQPAIIADLDNTRDSREIVDIIRQAASFTVINVVKEDSAAEAAVFTGVAASAVYIPEGFSKALAKGEAELSVIVDGSDANTAVRASQELTRLLSNQSIVRQKERLSEKFAGRGWRMEGHMPEIRTETRAWFNPQLKTAVFLVPGVLAMVLAVITMVFTAMGITREKEMGTLEQVMVSPLKPYELIIGKIVPFALFGMADVLLITITAFLVFDVPMTGSLTALFAVSAVYLMTTLGMGIFISTVSATQQQAMLNAFFVLMPALMLSGYIFPVEHMPKPAQWLTTVNPLRYYIELLRGLMVKGASVFDMMRALASLFAIGATVLIAASLRFRKRVS